MRETLPEMWWSARLEKLRQKINRPPGRTPVAPSGCGYIAAGAIASREERLVVGGCMLARILGAVAVAVTAVAPALHGQAAASAKEPVTDGRALSEWVADLKADAPQTRNSAAYEIAGLGPAAAAAVPALIVALDDPSPTVRFPVTVALGEIGPAAAQAVPRLKKMMDEEINDEIAASARRAIRRIKPEALADH
jgi:HEAT repeat protein